MPWKTKEARQQYDAAHREQQRESNRCRKLAAYLEGR